MNWFGLGSRTSPIFLRADYSVVLAAESAAGPPRRLTKLLYTGHDGDRGMIRAIVPGGETIWQAPFASEHDVRDGLLVVLPDQVITHDPKGGALVARELWTGTERWRTPLPRLVSRLGIKGKAVVVITADHSVHAIDLATGADHVTGQVMTDEARDDTINATPHPSRADTSRGDRNRSKSAAWSYATQALPGTVVLQRDWDGTTTWALAEKDGPEPQVQVEVGAGDYEGAMRVGELGVLDFRLGEERVHHLFLVARQPLELLGVMRAEGPSDFHAGGHSVWKGKL